MVMSNFNLSAAQIATYHKDGCLAVKDFLSNEEVKNSRTSHLKMV
jgi:hypothetical protein